MGKDIKQMVMALDNQIGTPHSKFSKRNLKYKFYNQCDEAQVIPTVHQGLHIMDRGKTTQARPNSYGQ